ncbi:hypothetical protein pEp_SNUABM03_00041 [Erwinia phage pEp_SNUABM_03]|nr:hypothetical protein pEp_SNUABM03_00041 [Erwinia phage pEp_SNUABM_03]
MSQFNRGMLKLVASLVFVTYAMSELTVSESLAALCFAGVGVVLCSGFIQLTTKGES